MRTVFAKSVILYALSKGWELFISALMILLVLIFFNPVQQGYHYTFYSLTIIGFVLEIGFGFVILQFFANEFGHLSFGPGGRIEGDEAARARLSSLVRLSLVWHGALGVSVPIILIVSGLFLFAASGEVAWQGPYVLLCIGTGLQAFANGLRIFLEGANRLAMAQGIVVSAGLIAGAAILLHVALGPNLYLLGIYITTKAVMQIVLLGHKVRPSFRSLPAYRPGIISWRKDFLPQQSRIAISWMSGILIFWCFTPIAFSVLGPEAAARIGLALQAQFAVNMVSMAWLYNVQPSIGAAWAQGQRDLIKNLARNAMTRGALTAAVLSVSGFIIVAVGIWLIPDYAERIVSLPAFAVLLVTVVVQQITNVQTATIRLRKDEPFMLNSITGGILCIVGLLIGAHLGKADYMIYAFALVMLGVMTPWVWRIFEREMADTANHSVSAPSICGPAKP